MLEQDKYILWLSRINGLGSKKLLALLNAFPDPEEIFTLPPHKLREVKGITEANARAIVAGRDKSLIQNYQKQLEKMNISFVTIQNSQYPPLLKEIHDPPAALYILGELPKNDTPFVSVIGARRCSEYGLTVSYKLSKDLSAVGVVVVSGMARGIDSCAHRGALAGGGPTIAVLGCGVDVCYPSENRELMAKIINNGCVVSEYPPGTRPNAGNFPARNRIISGLSEAVVVVEAAEKSGTLITVDLALEQGREVLAVPGNITSKLSGGVNDLIKQGACGLVSSYDDVLFALGYSPEAISEACEAGEAGKADKPCEKALNPPPDLSEADKTVYSCISYEPVSVDSICERTNMPVSLVQHSLTMLEINGHIKKLPGQRYIKYI